MKRSEWQNGVPPCDGVWEILVPEHVEYDSDGIYYARFKNGIWDSGWKDIEKVPSELNHKNYHSNNWSEDPRQWRGLIE